MSLYQKGKAVLSYLLGIGLALQGLGVLLPSVSRAATPTLRISEINWAGSEGDANDQWIELVNKDVAAIDFSVTPHSIVIPSLSETINLDALHGYGVLAPDQVLVIHRKSLPTSSIRSVAGTEYVMDATLELPTMAAEYEVYDQANGLGTMVDMIADTTFAGDAMSSMSRVDVLGTMWYTAQTIGAGFDTSVMNQYGTPGAMNMELDLPTAAITPANSMVLGDPMNIAGTAEGGVVVTKFTRTSFGDDPNHPVVLNYIGAIVAGAYTVTPSLPPLKTGRFNVDVHSVDGVGNRSKTVRVADSKGAVVNTDYEILAASSTVPTPVITPALPMLTNQSEIQVAGTLDNSMTTFAKLEVLVNGAYYGTFDPNAGGASFSFPVVLTQGNNIIQVVGVRDNAAYSLAASAMVTYDGIAPNMVDLTKVQLSANKPGTADSFYGMAGAAEGNTTLYVYGDQNLTNQIGMVMVAPDGSFPMVNIGDNKYAMVYLVLQDQAGNRSKAAALANPITNVVPGGLNVHTTDRTESTISFTWSASNTAVKYRVKYRSVHGEFSTPVDVCLEGNGTCALTGTIRNLYADTEYVIAVAAIDTYGNVSEYSMVGSRTTQAPLVQLAVAKVDRVTTRTITTTPATTATPAPTATPDDKGDVQSESTTAAARNWTPWIVLAVLVGIAVLATAGYFYWFGGEAGEAALASVMAERAKREEEEDKSKKGSGGKKDSKNRRW